MYLNNRLCYRTRLFDKRNPKAQFGSDKKTMSGVDFFRYSKNGVRKLKNFIQRRSTKTITRHFFFGIRKMASRFQPQNSNIKLSIQSTFKIQHQRPKTSAEIFIADQNYFLFRNHGNNLNNNLQEKYFSPRLLFYLTPIYP